MAAVAARVDERSAVFSWPDTLSGWCATLREREHADVRQLALRQYAAVLANLEAARMNLTTHGMAVGVVPGASVHTEHGDYTVGAWAAAAESELLALQGASLRDRATKQAYRRIEAAARAICRGRGMGSTCPVAREDERDDAAAGRAVALAMGESDVLPAASATPNPFRTSTRFAVSIADGAGANVELGVYDVSGRRMASLASGHFEAGRHEFAWDGRAGDGQRVRAGVYFLHGRVGGAVVRQSVMLVD